MKEIESVIHSINNRLTQPKIVRLCIIISFALFLPSLLVGSIIAMIWGPQGYSIWTNYISDLGSFNYTPAPFILDFSAMITSIFLIPVVLFFNKMLKTTSNREEGKKEQSEYRYIRHLGLLFLFIGLIGFFGIGLFSEDRSTALGLHYLFSVVVFGGLTLGAFFSGIYIILEATIFRKFLGIYMTVIPLSTAILFLITPEPFTKQFLEWLMLFGILIWLLIVDLKMLSYLKHEDN